MAIYRYYGVSGVTGVAGVGVGDASISGADSEVAVPDPGCLTTSPRCGKKMLHMLTLCAWFAVTGG